jgi:hypothetical protein
MSPSPIHREALAAHEAALSIVPPKQDGTKAPIEVWKKYQRDRAELDQLDRWYSNGCTGLGAVTGRVSGGVTLAGGEVAGGLEVLEFDDRETYERFRAAAARAGLNGLVDRIEDGYLEESPSGGIHWPYRCAEIAGNTKLARRPDPGRPHGCKVLIETRGEGGFIILAPSFGTVHPSGRPYRRIRGGFDSIAAITPEERADLWDLARSFDEMPDAGPEPTRPAASSGGEVRPGDDYAARTSWGEILGPGGWAKVYERDGVTYWRRPGKDRGVSATTGRGGRDCFYAFTSSTAFVPERSYTKFGAYALLEHGGDFAAATRALRAGGYGGPPRPPGEQAKGEPPPAPDPLDEDATAADLIRLNTTIRWVWEGWIPVGVLTILASEPGIGKTRLCADLLRRAHLGIPWPDGSAMTLPLGSTAIWVPADNQHAELGSFPGVFGFPPEALYLNATRRNPFIGTMLDTAEDLGDFEARILRVRPAFVFVDTSINATDRSSHKPEDAKAFFKPLQEIAARTQTAILMVTHLNAGGKPLGRRITGQGRVVIQMEKPDPEGQPDRRKLHVTKSNSLFPPPLGVTMGGNGNIYDDTPPVAPDGGEGGEVPRILKVSRLDECMDWIRERLEGGPDRVSDIRNDAEKAGYSTKTLYASKDRLPIQEYVVEGRKWWQLTDEDPAF